MQIIQWKMSGLFHADATKCKQEIENIGDDVTPPEVVEYARNPDTELHKCFTWDNDVAADKWRLYEARQVLCNIVVVDKRDDSLEPTSFRLFHKTDNTGGYKPLSLIIQNEDEYKKLLRNCETDLQTIKKKYQNLSEYQEIWDLIH